MNSEFVCKSLTVLGVDISDLNTREDVKKLIYI